MKRYEALADALARNAADFMRYFYGVEVSEHHREKLMDEWIADTLAEHERGVVGAIEEALDDLRDFGADVSPPIAHARQVLEGALGALRGR